MGTFVPAIRHSFLSRYHGLAKFDGILYMPKNRAWQDKLTPEWEFIVQEKQELELIRQSKILCHIIANKQDREDAFSPDQIRRRLDIPESIPIYPCIATDKTIVQRIVLELFKAMPPSDDVQTVIDFLSTPEVLSIDFDTVRK